MAHDQSTGLGCLGSLASIVAVIVGIYAIDWGWVRSEITVYSAQCAQKVLNNKCGHHQFTVRPTTYKVMVDQQAVVYWIEGFEVQKVTKCAVANRTSWTCKYDDESAEFGFLDGEYFNRSLDTPSPASKDFAEKEYYMPRWKYLLWHWQGK